MRIMKLLVVVLALVCSASTSIDDCFDAPNTPPFLRDQSINQELLRSQLDFSIQLLKTVGKLEPSSNVLLSPLSIFNTLMLAYFVSRGHTEENLKKALFLPKTKSKTDMLLSYRLQRYQSLEVYQSQVKSSNRMFLSKNQTVTDCAKTIFEDEIQHLDFSGNGLSRSVDMINSWVANVTQNKIQNLISAGDLSPNTQLILANAAYFKSFWKQQFDKRDTKMGKFYVEARKTVSVPMMFQHNTFNYWRSEELEADVLELPYEKNDISMVVLLPDSTQSIQTLLQRLDSRSVLNIVKELTSSSEIDVSFPKFTVERTVQLTSILQDLGVGDLFGTTSDLTGLTGGPRIHLNQAIHKAKIQVDEQGTEAAAATAILDIRIPSDGFVCDRPFLYFILDKTRTILPFAGILHDPTN